MIPKHVKIKLKILKSPSPDPEKKEATTKTGNKEADVNPARVIATPLMIFVILLIGISTFSSMTSVIPQ